ncbi:DUF5666 domain-containing protein [Marinimicrobium agarilyticum]|uniref:DUF5666 domain-containing protein n=1 Tax=Marinimicrobium agarilyticum TaxID=306546 RepID=UPI00042475F0|nr:DUF5666 domain-containing protein [Marinimicrobium agarilyticum]
MKHLTKSALATSIALIMTGCGGSSGDSTPNTSNPDNSGDSSNKVSSSGVITGFGSVYVNGVRYDTANAEVEFEGEGRMSEEDLRLGMRVEVEANQDGDDRRATRVVFDEDLKGPVSSVSANAEDPSLGALVVLGQTVTVDANTVLGDGVTDANMDGRVDLNDLDSSEGRVVVEVSGFPTDSGFIATRLERLNGNSDDGDDDDNEAEVKGTIAGLDTANGTFMIRDLEVHYEVSALEDDLEEGQLSNGWFVEVEGQVQADGSLLATNIEREDDRWEDEDEREGEFEIEGIVQAVDTDSTPNSVTINGQVITVTDASLLAGLVGTKVEIEGSFNAEGHLEIDADDDGIKQERTNNVEISDRVETVGTESFTTRMGVTITPTGLSRVEDDDGDDGDRLKPEEFMARLQAGDAIEARGYLAQDGTLTWNRIERDDDDDEACSLRGPVEAGSIDVSTGTFTMLGVTIDTASILSDGAFGDDDDSSLGRVNFFTALSSGAVIEAEGSEEDAAACSDGLLIAGEVEFESDDQVETTDDRDDEDSSDDDEDDQEDDDQESGDDQEDDDSAEA